MTDLSAPPAYCRGLFGIGALDGEGLRVQLDVTVTSLRIQVLGQTFLNFSALEVFGQDGEKIDPSAVSSVEHSPAHQSIKPWDTKADPFASKGFHSDFGKDRYYLVNFATPVKLSHLIIRNRLGRWGIRLLPLAIQAVNGADRVIDWKNFSVARLQSTSATLCKRIGRLAQLDESAAKDAIGSVEHFCGLSLDEIGSASESAVEAFGDLQRKLNALAKAVAKQGNYSAWPVIESIIDRYPEAENLAANTHLLSTYFALRLLDGGLGENFATVLASWNGHFTSASELMALEDSVVEVYQELGGQGKPSISRHGWFVSGLMLNRDAVIAGIANILSDLQKKLGKNAWLCYGSLLGAARNNDFIPYDDDADLAVQIPELGERSLDMVMESLQQDLRNLGYKANYDKKLEIIQIACPDAPKVGIDIFPCVHESKELDGLCRMKHAGMRWRYLSRELLFPLSEVSLGTSSLPAPRNIELFLEWRYGTSWRTPLKYFEMDWIFSR